MRILFVTATYTPSINGVAIVVANIKKALEAKGHQVLVLAPKNKKTHTEETSVIRYPSLENPVSEDYPIPLFPGVKAIYKLIETKGFDLVHVHHPFHVGYFARLIAKRNKIPLVFTYHTNYDEYAEKYLEFLPKKLKRQFIENTVYKFCKKTDLVVSPSEHIADMFRDKMPYLRIAVIPSSVGGLERLSSTKNDLRKRLNLPMGKKLLLCVSRLSLEKDVDILIRSLKHLPEDFCLVLVGDGPVRGKLEKIAKKLNLTKRVYFIGRVAHEEVGKYYQSADIFCFASKTETQGLVFLEAVSMGLPIAAISSKAASEWVKPDFGMVTHDGPESLANGILQLFKKDRKKLKKEAFAYSKNFTQDRMVLNLLSAYEKTIRDYKVAKKLLSTGWQSWSPVRNRVLKIPKWNYNPTGEEYIPVLTGKKTNKQPITGWCSWYAYGEAINQQKILANANWFADNKSLPVKYILIDGGWTTWGDWNQTDVEKFPNGLKYTADKIKKLGLLPGIWIAPFLADPKSVLFKKHKSWFIKRNGRYPDGLRSFFVQSVLSPKYILDVRRNEVRNYLYKQIKKLVKENKFALLKLDFLYSVYFIPGIRGKEAGGILRELLAHLRRDLDGVFIIACGCPLVPAMEVVDAMRIGPDIISPEMDNVFLISKLLHTHKLNRILGNISKRSWTSKFWNLDPDVFVCRKTLGLTDIQILSLQKVIIQTKGNIFLGDDMTRLTEEEVERYIIPLFE